MLATLKRWLAHPLTRDLDIDDPRTTALRRRIIAEKRGLRRVYARWYDQLVRHIPKGNGAALELGSGGGYLADRVEDVITSDVFVIPGLNLVADARKLPFDTNSLRSIVMVDVFHHIPDSSAFLVDAVRCLRSGGTVVMIEPWATTFSTLIYRYLHHEPFEREAVDWMFPATGPLSAANGALPWMVFERDAALFAQVFPELAIRRIEPTTVITYLLSGGVSMRSLVPDVLWFAAEALEWLLRPLRRRAAMFALIVLERR
jgi:SAM-dependent methyltransferase